MKIKWGALVVDGRGKIGGHVASKNKAGSYLRTKTTPTNPQTAAQTGARQRFGAISQGWSGLSATTLAAWNAAVAEWQTTDIFGDLKQPSGKALYQRLNNQAQSSGYAAVTTPPSKQDMVVGIVTAVNVAIISANLTLVGAYTGSGARVMVFGTPVLSDGTSFVKNKLRLFYSDATDTFDPSTAYSNYTAKFGTPNPGTNAYFAVKYVLANGQASPLQIIQGTLSV